MSDDLPDDVFEEMLAHDAAQRYRYFVEQVARNDEVWFLGDGERPVTSSAQDGARLVPMWPHARFAEAARSGPWAGRDAFSIDREQLLEELLPYLEQAGDRVSVFPLPTGESPIVEPPELAADLRQAAIGTDARTGEAHLDIAYELSEEEFQKLLSADGPERVQYFIDRVRETRAVWLLGDDDSPVTWRRDDGTVLVPAWPHYRFAEVCAEGEWEDMEAFAVDLPQWLDDLLPYVKENGQRLSVFPLPDGRTVVLDADEFADDVRRAMKERET